MECLRIGADAVLMVPLPFVDQIRDIVVYHDCRLKYDKQICLIVHNAYKRAVLLLKCFHIHEKETF